MKIYYDYAMFAGNRWMLGSRCASQQSSATAVRHRL